MKLEDIYKTLDCSKQNISYWKSHPFSTQYRKKILKVIEKSAEFFELSDAESEALANSAGLSMCENNRCLESYIKQCYSKSRRQLSRDSLISERMLRYYKKITPAKQALVAIALAMNVELDELKKLLSGYGYTLSESIVGDVVVVWYMNHSKGNDGVKLINMINETLNEMGLPLLMTREK